MGRLTGCVIIVAALGAQALGARAQGEARSFAAPQLRPASEPAARLQAAAPTAVQALPVQAAPPPWPPTAEDLAARRRQATGQAAPAAATGWPQSEVLIAKARCTALLKDVEAVYMPLEGVREAGDCGAPAPVQLMAIGKSPQVVVSPPAVVTCEMVAALAQWLASDIQPSARKLLGSPIVKIESMSSYSCRNAYGRTKSRLSEHGRANALDIRGFLTASGHGTDLLADWGPTMRDIRAAEVAIAQAAAAKAAAAAAARAETERKSAAGPQAPPAPVETGSIPGGIGTLIEGVPRLRVLTTPRPSEETAPAFAPHGSRLGGPKPTVHSGTGSSAPADSGPKILTPPSAPGGFDRKQRFLREAHASACRTFKTVLGPEANNAHRNHFHVDLAERVNGVAICE
jgi:hypothetical protein